MIQHFGTLPPFAPLGLPSRAPFPRAQASCWVSRCLPGLVAAPAPQSCSMLLYTKCLTRQALFALPWMAELHAQCHTHKRCVTVVLHCRRARAEVWKRILRWPRYPPTHLRGCRPSFVCALPFLPAGQRAAVGAKRGLRHTRDACTGGKSAPSGRTHLASRGPAWTGG